MSTRREFLTATAAVTAAPLVRGADAPAKKPNIIHINVDTWSAWWLGCYGNASIRTPNLDALAARSCIFLDAYAECLYTIPMRRVLYTGRRAFPGVMVKQWDDVAFRAWHPLFVEDVTMAETLLNAGYLTALVSDVFHQFKTEKNFHRGFLSWQWIRGQQIDRYKTGPGKGIDVRNFLHPSQYANSGSGGGAGSFGQYLVNRQFWRTDDDLPAAQVFSTAAQWLEDNVESPRPLYLHVESFAPHPFWDPPDDYYRLYMKSDYKGPKLIYPPDNATLLSPVELEHARSLYFGYVTFVDAQIGKFLARADKLGLMRNTLISFTADHGVMLGERGVIHKGENTLQTQVTRVPLIFYTPWGGESRIKGLVQHTDWMPTMCELAGVNIPGRVTGQSLKPLIDIGDSSKREWIVGGFHNHGFIRTPEWMYTGRFNSGDAFENLYDIQKDPQELTDILQRQPALRDKFRAQLKDYAASGWEITKGSFLQPEPETQYTDKLITKHNDDTASGRHPAG